MKICFDGIVLFPKPFPRLTLDSAPRDVIFVCDQAKALEMNLRFRGWWRFEDVRSRKCANGRRLNESNRKISARNVPGPAVEAVICGCGGASNHIATSFGVGMCCGPGRPAVRR